MFLWQHMAILLLKTTTYNRYKYTSSTYNCAVNCSHRSMKTSPISMLRTKMSQLDFHSAGKLSWEATKERKRDKGRIMSVGVLVEIRRPLHILWLIAFGEVWKMQHQWRQRITNNHWSLSNWWNYKWKHTAKLDACNMTTWPCCSKMT